jgi:hypothetical protein
MATRHQITRLGAQIERLAAVLDPDDALVTVAVFDGETADFALSWHCRRRPEHAGRRVQLEWRNETRREASDVCALSVATAAERAELQRWLLRPVLGERNFVMTDEEREADQAVTAELLAGSATWARDYQEALAAARLVSSG